MTTNRRTAASPKGDSKKRRENSRIIFILGMSLLALVTYVCVARKQRGDYTRIDVTNRSINTSQNATWRDVEVSRFFAPVIGTPPSRNKREERRSGMSRQPAHRTKSETKKKLTVTRCNKGTTNEDGIFTYNTNCRILGKDPSRSLIILVDWC